MIRAECGQPREADHAEMRAVKQVVERPAQERVVGVKSVVHAAAHARVEQPADLAKQPRGGRPRHVVEVARDDDRRVAFALGHALGHRDQLGVALGGGVVLGRARWLRVHAVQAHAAARAQHQHGVHRGRVVLDQKLHPAVFERQARVEEHAVEVVERALHGVGIVALEGVEPALPPGVGLQRDQHIGAGALDDGQQRVGIAVGHEHVDAHDRQALARLCRVERLHFPAPERGVRQDPPRLVEQAGQRGRSEPPGAGLGAVEQEPLRRQQQQGEDGVLQAREILPAHPPDFVAPQRQQRERDQQGHQREEQPEHLVCLSRRGGRRRAA